MHRFGEQGTCSTAIERPSVEKAQRYERSEASQGDRRSIGRGQSVRLGNGTRSGAGNATDRHLTTLAVEAVECLRRNVMLGDNFKATHTVCRQEHIEYNTNYQELTKEEVENVITPPLQAVSPTA